MTLPLRLTLATLVCAASLAAQTQTRIAIPMPAATPGLVKLQLLDSVKATVIGKYARVTVLEPAAGLTVRVVVPGPDSIVSIDSLRSGRVIVRLNAIGFNPVTDTLRYDAIRGLVKRYALTYAVVRVNTFVAGGDGLLRRVPPR